MQNGIRKDRYERAVEWLKGVQRGNISVNGIPLLGKEERERDFLWMGNPKRTVHFKSYLNGIRNEKEQE